MSTMKQKLLARLADLIHGYVPRYTGYDLDQAYQEGFSADYDAVQEHIDGKDEFIERQGALIVEMMEVLDMSHGWEHVSPETREALRSYV